MGFASAWLKEKALFPALINSDPSDNTGIIVVIPAYGEEDVLSTVKSLSLCDQPPCRCEAIVIVNTPSGADQKAVEINKRTTSILKAWKNEENGFFRLFYCDLGTPDIPHWGVGYARKAGMDEAVRRFNASDQPNGVIASLDADCTVSKNYFTEMYHQLFKNNEQCGCSITLFNRRPDENLSEELLLAAAKYELSRRYQLFGMHYAGYPWCFYIAGSALAVKADTYIKSGGMNKREAGEDFWFVRKLLPSEKFFHIRKITIDHSARISLRVPFGTGKSINDHVSSGINIEQSFADPAFFDDLKLFWNRHEALFRASAEEISSFYDSIPDSLKEFLQKDKFLKDIAEIASNTSSQKAFSKRFFLKYDTLFGQRYLNFMKKKCVKDTEPLQACRLLAEKAGFKKTGIASFYSALSFYRDSEAWISCSPF